MANLNFKHILGMAIVLVVLCTRTAYAYSGIVTYVYDGDTVQVQHGQKKEKIRLYGIDCPEKGQAYANVAKNMTMKLLLGKTVQVIPQKEDQYNRTVAILVVENAVVQERLLETGMAWVYPQFCRILQCNDWKKLEADARKSKKGLWQQKAVAPWQWRRQ